MNEVGCVRFGNVSIVPEFAPGVLGAISDSAQRFGVRAVRRARVAKGGSEPAIIFVTKP